MFRKKMIVDPLAEWTNNTTTGLYEDVIARVMRIEKRTNIVNTIKRVRHDEINDNILRFYGWQEQSDFYYFAYEKCEHTLEEYVRLHNFTEFSGSKQLRLDILRFVFEEEIEEKKDEHKGKSCYIFQL
ncbi:serine/threonine-protein kinase/endoribonuclease IRE1 [Tanacetum coccineum]